MAKKRIITKTGETLIVSEDVEGIDDDDEEEVIKATPEVLPSSVVVPDITMSISVYDNTGDPKLFELTGRLSSLTAKWCKAELFKTNRRYVIENVPDDLVMELVHYGLIRMSVNKVLHKGQLVFDGHMEVRKFKRNSDNIVTITTTG